MKENIDEDYIISTEETEEETEGETNANDSEFLTIIQTEKHMWSYDETLALIEFVQQRFKEMHNPRKRKGFWLAISADLKTKDIHLTPITCQKKWQNMLRTYKSIKELKLQSKQGKLPSKFLYYDRLEEVLADNNSSIHCIDVNKPTTSVEIDNTLPVEDDETLTKTTTKRKNLSADYMRAKQKFYKEKELSTKCKEQCYKNYLKECLKLKARKLELLEKKLNIDERKTRAIEELVKQKKRFSNNNYSK